MFVLAYDREKKTLRYASAGHEPAHLLRGRHAAQVLAATGPLLGLSQEGRWGTETVPLSAGCRLLVLTDGLVETRGPDGRPLGRERLADALQEPRDETLDSLLSRLLSLASALRGAAEQEDDITLLAASF